MDLTALEKAQASLNSLTVVLCILLQHRVWKSRFSSEKVGAVLVAVALILATSLPAKGSEIAKQIRLSPSKHSLPTLVAISGVPKSITGGNPITRPVPSPSCIII